MLFTNDTPPGVFYLTKGYVRSYLLSKEGKELTVSLLKPYDIFPMQWVMNNLLTSHYFEALTEVEVYRASKENFLEFLQTNNDVFFSITSKTLLRYHEASERREAAILGNASEKVAGILAFLAHHFGTKFQKEIHIDIAFTHRDIASLTGLTRETVSLEMERFEKEQLITHKDHKIIIKNIQELQNSANVM
jgi:CRP-like cAMP-binding protein